MRAHVHPDGGWFVAGRGWVRCRARTRPSARRLFCRRSGLGSLAAVHTSVWTSAGVAWHLFACHFVASCARCPESRHLVSVVAWHLSVCPVCGWRRASLTCLVASRGAPCLARSGRSRWSGRLSRCRGAFPHPTGFSPRFYWAAARGTRRPAEKRAYCACRWPLPRQGRWARSASYPFGALRWGCPWRVLPASVLGWMLCGGLRV